MRDRRTRISHPADGVVALVLLLAACGGDGNDRADPVAASSETSGPSTDSRRESDGTESDDESDDDGSTRGDDDGGDPNGTEAATPPGPMPTLDEHLTCPESTVDVTDADGLSNALAAAQPGDVIRLAAGTYKGRFVATATATDSEPIYVCGSRDTVIDGGGIKGGYALHLDGASGWRLVGFTVRNAQKGVVADRVFGTIFEGLLVEDVGDEAIHLRTFSTDNVVRGNEIRDTGQRRDKFGEGVYVGTAESNWCKYTDCDPDRSDHNVIEGNLIYGTTAESIDLKEGTTGGVVRNNSFDGSALSGADSWVDAKGNEWVIESNVGVNSPMDGFQMHEIVEGWATANVFRDNVARVHGPGHGFAATNTEGNIISCDNEVFDAADGFADVECEAAGE